jgi:ATP-dependent helicase/nuclease subunit B
MNARAGRPELINSGYGRDALTELTRLVRVAKKGDPLAPVTVLVPTNGVGVAARRWLASDGTGVGNVSFTTVHRLAESFGAPALAAQKRRPVSPPIVLAALRHELANDAGVLAPVGDHPATEEALLRVDRELTGMTAAGLHRLSSLSRRAADVVRLHRATRARLSAQWYDEADLLLAATEHLGSLPRLDKRFGPLIVFLPQRLSPRARGFLAMLADTVATTVIVAMTTGQDADRDIIDLLDDLKLSVGLPMPAPLQSVTEVIASDPDDEVRVAIRHVLVGLAEGLRLDRCALLYPNSDPYGPLVADRLDEAGLSWNGPDGRDLSDTVLGHAAIALVELAGSELRRADVFAFLASVPARHAGRPIPVAAWERISRQAGIVAGRHEWKQQLTGLRQQLMQRADSLARQGEEGRAARLVQDAERIDPFVTFVEEFFARLDRLRELRLWKAAAGSLQTMLNQLLGNELIRANWPITEQRTADEVEALLDQLATLDPVDPGPTLIRFQRALTHALTNAAIRRGRRGTGLVVGPLGEALGLDLDLVIMVGAAEGIMPAIIGDDPVLPDRERRATRELDLSSTRPWQQQREFLAAAAAAGHGRLVVTWPQGDLRQRAERRRSRWIGPLLSPTETTEVGAFSRSLREATALGTEHEARLQALIMGAPPNPDDGSYRLAAALISARASDEFTAYDGHVGHEVADVLNLGTFAMSPTRLQMWASCPHSYFMRYVLNVEPVEDPADELTLTPLDEGNLVHKVLDRFVDATINGTATTEWTSAAEQQRLRAIFDEEADLVEVRGRSGRSVYWRYDRERVWDNLITFVQRDAERLAHQHATPVGSEVGFGNAGEPAAVLTLPNGRQLSFRGSIDRVDRTVFGHLEVTDYKTGKSDSYAKLTAEAPDDNGVHLQLPIYALAARAAFADHDGATVQSSYRFVNKGATKRDVGYVVDDDVLALFSADVEVIVNGIEQGLFPARPQATTRQGFTPCQYCDPDGMGVAELDREWTRKQTAEVLAAYRRLLGVDDGEEDGSEVETND